jgi:hypothetical protein
MFQNLKTGDILLNILEKEEAERKVGSRRDQVFCRM